jgi:hypothetical protein
MEEDMSEIIEPKIEEQPGEALSWSKVWISAITRPSVATFERIIRDPNASSGRAYAWLFTSALIGGLINILINDLVGSMTKGYNSITCGPLITAVVAALSVVFMTWVIQLIASRLFGGSGTYASLIYATAAWVAPIYIFSSLISGIPYINCLSLPLGIYGIVLGVMAVKAVNKTGWAQAAASYISGFVLVVGIVAVFTICTLTILGPNVSEVFQNTLKELESGGATP